MKNKILKGIFILLFVSIVLPTHIHNEDCGYNHETGKGCIYEVEPFIDKWIGD